jgi:hypothetical protein
MSVQCVPVISSWVRFLILTADGELAVQFYDRRHKRPDVCCLYPGTTVMWFNSALVAPSKGKWVHQWLYKKWPYKIVRPPCTAAIRCACCTNGLSADLVATVSGVFGPATFPLAYDAAAANWTGSGPICTGHSVRLQLACPPTGSSALDFRLVAQVDPPTGAFETLAPDPNAACDPLFLQFQNVTFGSLCNPAGGSYVYTITE